MSVTRRIFFGAAASWFSRCVTIFLGLVLMPVLFRHLPKEELGIWLLIGQSWAALGILDFGIGVTLTRRIAFAKGRSGSDPGVSLTGETQAEIADLVATGLRIYRLLALFSLVFSFGLGFFYLRSLPLESLPLSTVWSAWGLLCLSFALTTWAAPWTCLLQGVGYVGWDALLTSFVSAFILIAQLIAVLSGGGLVALSLVAVTGALAQRLIFLAFARQKRPELFRLKGRWCGETFRAMTPLAIRAWLTALGSALILYTDQFVITSFEGLAGLPAYRASWVLIHNVSILAVTLAMASGVFVSHLWQNQEIQQVHRVLERNLRIGWLLMLGASALLLLAAPALFQVWLGVGNFIGLPILLAILLTETLETQSFTIATAARATGVESYAASYIIGGFLKLGLSVWLASNFGLLGVAMGTLIALLLTNHWFVPWHGLKRLRYPRRKLLTRTILPCLLFFALPSALLTIGLRPLLPIFTPIIQLVVSIAVVGILLLPALWFLVLEPDQRKLLIHRFSAILPV